jgi:membrane fusion protein (multidrug efflux system)
MMKALVAILALSTSVAAGTAVYLSANRPKFTPKPAMTATVPTADALADVTPIARRTPAERADVGGRLVAGSEFEVRTTTSGSVLHARVDPGDFVEKGQTLIELENIALDESVRRAETTLEQAKSDLEAQQARRANIEQSQASTGRFAGRGGLGHFARSDEQQARARLTEAENALAKVRQAQGDSQIVSPIGGYVTERRVSIGDRVSPGTEVVHVVDISILKLTVDVVDVNSSETLSTREALVTCEAVPGRQFVGRVIRSLSNDTAPGHTNTLTIEVANPDRVLKPGMAARARLVSESSSELAYSSRSGSYGSLLRRQSASTANGPSDADLFREMVSSLKGLAVTLAAAAEAQNKELTRKQEAAKVTVEATTQYFGLLERQVNDLRPENAAHHAVSLEKAADEIDSLPILHVDDELLAFGADVAQSLRSMAERRRSISRSRSNTDVIVSDEAQAENSAIRTQGIQKITIGLAGMRRKMTKKYNLEFLANAGNLRAAASTRRHTARR